MMKHLKDVGGQIVTSLPALVAQTLCLGALMTVLIAVINYQAMDVKPADVLRRLDVRMDSLQSEVASIKAELDVKPADVLRRVDELRLDIRQLKIELAVPLEEQK